MKNHDVRVLFVDDDENLLRGVWRLLRKNYDLTVAQGPTQALQILEEEDPFAVIVSDQNMPEMKGDQLLEITAKRWPDMVRLMLTGNNDQHTVAKAVNAGGVFKFIRKPCSASDLRAAIGDSIRQHELVTAEKVLLERTLSGSVKMLTEILALSNPDVFRRCTIIQNWCQLLSKHMAFERPWELNIAGMLCQLGMVILPDSVVEKWSDGSELSEKEKSLMENVPEASQEFLKNIPRLEAVSEMIYLSRRGYDGSGFPQNGPKGIQIPQRARVLHILMDLADIIDQGLTLPENAFEQLGLNRDSYDPELLEKIETILSPILSKTEKVTFTKMSVPLESLMEGDVLLQDIVDADDKMLLSKGCTLSPLTVKRIRSFIKLGTLKGMVEVKRRADQAAA